MIRRQHGGRESGKERCSKEVKPLEAWAAELRRIVEPVPDNVVSIKRA